MLPSGKRFGSFRCKTNRLTNSFYPWAARTLNAPKQRVCMCVCHHTAVLIMFMCNTFLWAIAILSLTDSNHSTSLSWLFIIYYALILAPLWPCRLILLYRQQFIDNKSLEVLSALGFPYLAFLYQDQCCSLGCVKYKVSVFLFLWNTAGCVGDVFWFGDCHIVFVYLLYSVVTGPEPSLVSASVQC